MTWVRLGGKYLHSIILATLPSTYENLLKLVEICRSSDRNKNVQFFIARQHTNARY